MNARSHPMKRFSSYGVRIFPAPAALALLASLAAPPALATEMSQTENTFEGLLGERYRLGATSTPPGLISPLPYLAKDSVPAIYVCMQQFRICARLTDSKSNPPTPGGAPFPPLSPR